MTEKEAIKKLKAMALERIKTKSPELPYPESFVHIYETRKANGLTRAVKDWIKFTGGQAERISVTGRPIDNTRIVTDVLGRKMRIGSIDYIKPTMTRGSADISATILGRSVKIEIKIGHDRQSEFQKRYQNEIEEAGGIYLIVHDLAGFADWHTEFINK